MALTKVSITPQVNATKEAGLQVAKSNIFILSSKLK
jgi:hypothetical protein